MALPYLFKAKTVLEQGRTSQVAVDTIKNWFKSEFLLELQEEFIVLFLLSCMNDISSTKKTLEEYFRIKNEAPQIFTGYNFDSKEMTKMLNVTGFCVIPKRLDDNVAVILTKLNDTNYRNCDVVGTIKIGCMLLNLSQMYDPPNEVVLVIDMKGVGFMHLTCIKMGAMLSFLEYVQEGMPLKIKNIHVLNSNYVFDKVISLFKKFIKSDILDNILSHSPDMNMEDFNSEFIPADCLPEEYGGNLGPMQQLMDDTVQELKNLKHFFHSEELLRQEYKKLQKKL